MSESKRIKSGSVKKSVVKKAVPKQVKETVKKGSASAKKSPLDIFVYGIDGKESKTLSLPKEIFDIEASPRLLAQYVRVYLANQRQGNANTKSRGEIIGSTKKIYRQKGTGRARHGSKKAPIFIGGGIVGGPRTTDHSLKMNKKQKQKALLYSLSLKAKEGAVIAVENALLKMKPKTKTIVDLMKHIGTTNVKTLVVVPKMETNGFILSVRNLQKVNAISALSMNAYEVLNHKKIIFTEDAVDALKEHYKKAE